MTVQLVEHTEYLARRRFAVLDGLRAISILLVFTAHPAHPEFWPRFHGAAGVTIFFVLSGFLITTLLLREEARNGRVDLRAFYIRRLFRIYPMYFLVLLLYCVLILLIGLQPERRAGFVDNLPYFIFFFPERAIFFDGVDVQVPFNMSWSIGIEEKFYLVWPLLAFVALAAHKRWRVAAIASIAVAFTICAYTAGAWAPVLAPYANICFGVVVALLLHHRRTFYLTQWLGRPRVLAGLVGLSLVTQFGTDEILQSGLLYVPYGVLIALVLSGLLTTTSQWVNWLSSRVMVYIGALSYCLYLIHNFGLNAAEMVVPSSWGLPGSFLSTAVGLGLAFVAAHLLHKYFEEPLRLLGVRLARQKRRAAALPAVTESEIEQCAQAVPSADSGQHQRKD